jgi:hypothetical protein
MKSKTETQGLPAKSGEEAHHPLKCVLNCEVCDDVTHTTCLSREECQICEKISTKNMPRLDWKEDPNSAGWGGV